jgi:hypothetical protein
MTNNKGHTGVSRSEWLVDIGGWLVIVGLALEVVLALVFHDNEPWYERWSLVLANAIIAGGVWLEIHFGGIVRAEANAREAEANARAEEARLELEQLKAKMAWRRVTKEQHNILVSELKGKPIRVWLTFVGTDPESTVFRDDLNRALTEAGVETEYFSGYGMAVGLTISNDKGQARDWLIRALEKTGLPLTQVDTKGMIGGLEGQLEIRVGTKPPPF